VVCLAVVVVVVLGHAASVAHSHTVAMAAQERGVAVHTAQRLVERLRADTDFAGLYARLAARTAESAGDTLLVRLGPDRALTMHAASVYYGDFVPPASLGTVRLLVQVPVGSVGGAPALREDLVAPRYGLPADLNGDGLVNGTSRDADYLALPVVVRVRWQRAGQDLEEVVLPAWLRGER
jgi:hypothetical protein